MMKHTEILASSANILMARADQYGPADETFDRVSQLATLVLNKDITPYEVAIIMHCMKLGRMATSRQNSDHYVDGINYLAFAGEMAKAQKPTPTQVEDDIIAMARKFAPVQWKSPAEAAAEGDRANENLPV